MCTKGYEQNEQYRQEQCQSQQNIYIYIDPFYVNNFILKILKKKII